MYLMYTTLLDKNIVEVILKCFWMNIEYCDMNVYIKLCIYQTYYKIKGKCIYVLCHRKKCFWDFLDFTEERKNKDVRWWWLYFRP